MDDQQHAVSAMVAARNISLDAPNAPRRAPIPENALLVVLAAIALLNPARLVQRGASCSRIRMSVIGIGVLGVLTVLGGPILRALDVSAATAIVGSGAAVVVTMLVALIAQLRRQKSEAGSDIDYLLNGVLRPEILLLALSVGAGGQGWTWIVTAAFVVSASMFVPPKWAEKNSHVLTWGVQLLTICALVLGIALIVDGVYAI
jgi:uncharacterized MnhB-related membrane protein